MPLEITAKALKDLKAMPAKDAKAIVAKLQAYADTGAGDVKKLQDREGYRLRHGDWRALFVIEGDVIVMRVVKRGEAYR